MLLYNCSTASDGAATFGTTAVLTMSSLPAHTRGRAFSFLCSILLRAHQRCLYLLVEHSPHFLEAIVSRIFFLICVCVCVCVSRFIILPRKNSMSISEVAADWKCLSAHSTGLLVAAYGSFKHTIRLSANRCSDRPFFSAPILVFTRLQTCKYHTEQERGREPCPSPYGARHSLSHIVRHLRRQ